MSSATKWHWGNGWMLYQSVYNFFSASNNDPLLFWNHAEFILLQETGDKSLGLDRNSRVHWQQQSQKFTINSDSQLVPIHQPNTIMCIVKNNSLSTLNKSTTTEPGFVSTQFQIDIQDYLFEYSKATNKHWSQGQPTFLIHIRAQEEAFLSSKDLMLHPAASSVFRVVVTKCSREWIIQWLFREYDSFAAPCCMGQKLYDGHFWTKETCENVHHHTANGNDDTSPRQCEMMRNHYDQYGKEERELLDKIGFRQVVVPSPRQQKTTRSTTRSIQKKDLSLDENIERMDDDSNSVGWYLVIGISVVLAVVLLVFLISRFACWRRHWVKYHQEELAPLLYKGPKGSRYLSSYEVIPEEEEED